MNAVLGMGEVLSESDLDDEQRQYIKILLESGKSLLNLIDDILDLTKIEAGEVLFESMSFDLEKVVDNSFKISAYTGHQKSLDLDFCISPEVPRHLLGDPHRLQQIIINLLGNAIKFTESGFVCLDISIAPGSSCKVNDTAMVHFCVRDSGVGVAPDKLAAVFDTFTQADASTTRQYGGTGLGLSICRSLCEKLDGKIWMESHVGQGCSVSFILPFVVPETDDPSPSVLAGKSFLLIDGREYAKNALAARMEQAGAKLEIAADLDAGIRAVQSIDKGADALDRKSVV